MSEEVTGKGTVFVYADYQRMYLKFKGQIWITPSFVKVNTWSDERASYRNLTIPLTSVMMIEWEIANGS